ncbi:HPP family protein [Shewanella marisflavi]|uniref:HPP family protein n=1 Tax=Shewanella marisflavi TaxID=260364 RepID=UPI00200DB048|nr:HPP family protein [Shewanella marisflavi]MCL1042391.1 HPP family protein [Shewanella marisflavi]
MNKLAFALISGMGAALAIGLLSYAETLQSDLVLLMVPFGATAVLVFGVPESPLAQPRNVIFGHLLTCAIGLYFFHYVGVNPFTLALASGLAVSAMLLTKTTHPPAGATPLLVMLTGQDWWFLLSPVLTGAVIIVLVGKLIALMHKRLARQNLQQSQAALD